MRDFIPTSAIIVLRPESSGPVREEIEYLAETDFLQRIIVIDPGDQGLAYLPERLHGCVLSQKDAMRLIALTASNPRLFKDKAFDYKSILICAAAPKMSRSARIAAQSILRLTF